MRAATNAPRAALFFNGERIAVEDFDHAHGTKLTLDARLPYSRGVLEAVAYDENGTEIARDSVQSFGDAVKLQLSPDKTTLKANGRDMIFLEISALDVEDNFVANANNRVSVQVTGAGRLVGLDNGDSTDYDSYKGTSRRLFSGKLLAMIAAKSIGGDIDVKVTSRGLDDAEIKLCAVEISPEEFIAKTSKLIVEAKATMVVNHITYHELEDRYDSDIFAERMPENITKALKVNKNVQDYVFPDSQGERDFAKDLEAGEEVVVYAKLPRTFQIPTPIGNYAPDWAIAFKEGSVKHVCFVAETKGSLGSLNLRGVEKAKINCAKKLFNEMSTEDVRYDVVHSYDDLLNIVSQ